MLKIEKTVLPSPEQWRIIIEGMRNPKNSWCRMDSFDGCDAFGDSIIKCDIDCVEWHGCRGMGATFHIGENDHGLMMGLAKGGAVHAKYRRMIPVWVTINAPLYWWKEFDAYKVGTVANSCSTMHKIHAKEFTLDDFSCEHMAADSVNLLDTIMDALNEARKIFIDFDAQKTYGDIDPDLKTAKDAWWQMIQLLPSSYNQKRTIMLNYEVLCNMYHSRKDHKLDEWHTFCDWIKTLPYSELVVGE